MKKRKLLCNVLPELYAEIDAQQSKAGLYLPGLGVWSQEEVVWCCKKHKEPYRWTTQVGYRAKGGDKPRPCPECARVTKLQEKSAILQQKGVTADRLALVRSEYRGDGHFDSLSLYSMAKLDWACIKCGQGWSARISSRLLRNNNCPKCHDKTSANEKRMRQALDDLAIPYKTQVKIGPSKVDLYIDKGVLSEFPLVVEIDGEFHFRGDPDQLRRDRTLDSYCADNGIHLLRVHHKAKRDYRLLVTDLCEHLQANSGKIVHCFVTPEVSVSQ